MFHTAAPLPGRSYGDHGNALWDLDMGLLPHLRAIVAGAAEAGWGACLVMADRGGPRLLVSVRGDQYSWYAPAALALDRGELVSASSVVAAPVRGPHNLRGALLLYHGNPDGTPPNVDRLACAHAARLEAALQHSTALYATTENAIEALLIMLDAHDAATARHARLVSRLARTLGEAAGLAPHKLLELERAARLHDIGKSAVAPRLLHKAGPLTTTEWAQMRQHPAHGERIIRAMPALEPLAGIVRHHHEQWGGNGYPDRLTGAAIPLGARLVAVADAYECMRTGRTYRPALSRDEALKELHSCAGTQFDPSLVALLPALDDFPIN